MAGAVLPLHAVEVLALALQPALDRLGLGYDMVRGNERAFRCIGALLPPGGGDCSSSGLAADKAALEVLHRLHDGLLLRNASSSGDLGKRLLCGDG